MGGRRRTKGKGGKEEYETQKGEEEEGEDELVKFVLVDKKIFIVVLELAELGLSF